MKTLFLGLALGGAALMGITTFIAANTHATSEKAIVVEPQNAYITTPIKIPDGFKGGFIKPAKTFSYLAHFNNIISKRNPLRKKQNRFLC